MKKIIVLSLVILIIATIGITAYATERNNDQVKNPVTSECKMSCDNDCNCCETGICTCENCKCCGDKSCCSNGKCEMAKTKANGCCDQEKKSDVKAKKDKVETNVEMSSCCEK